MVRLPRLTLIAVVVVFLLTILAVDTPTLATSPPPDQITNELIVVNGLLRQYRLFVPGSYSGRTSVHGLAVVFHGHLADDSSLIPYVTPVASRRGLVVAFPQGLEDSWNAGGCCGAAKAAHIDDVGFATQLISALSARFHPRSVVVGGYSNGAMLSWLLACQRAGSVNAVVDASGTEGVAETACRPSRPVTVVAVHGRKDPTVPYNGGGAPQTNAAINADPFRGIIGVLNEWGMAHNQCARQATSRFVGWSATHWSSCAGTVSATLYTVDNMGHDVPSSAAHEPVDFGTLIADAAARAR